MDTFPSLLTRALHLCNRRGTALTVGVAIAGLLVLLLQTFLWRGITAGTALQMHALLGDAKYASIQSTLQADTYTQGDIDLIMQTISAHIEEKTKQMTPAAQAQYIAVVMAGFARALAPAMALFGGLLVLIRVVIKSYFLVLCTRSGGHPAEAFIHSLRALPALVALWVLQWLLSGLWLVYIFAILAAFSPIFFLLFLISLVPFALLFPRLLFAPIVYLEDKKTIWQSITHSYRHTQKKWKRIVFPLIGLTAVLWMVTNFFQVILSLLIDAVLTHSDLAFTLFWIVPFLVLILVAYRLAFMVELKRDVIDP